MTSSGLKLINLYTTIKRRDLLWYQRRFQGVVQPPSPPPDHFKGFRTLLNIGRCGEPNLRKKDKRRTRKFFTSIFYVFLHNMCLKYQKSGRKLVMLCRKSKNAERKGIERNFFANPCEIIATPWRCLCHPLEEILKPPLYDT